MTQTLTQTSTFTITQARYVTSKIAADLDLMRIYYGEPSAERVSAFAEEAALLLAWRYLGSVEYGMKRDGKVIFSLKYFARSDGSLQVDDRPGRVPPSLNLAGATFYSYLTYSPAFLALSAADQRAVEAALPLQRSGGSEPVTGAGYWEVSRSYSKSGEGVVRHVFRPS